jgi:hypothetical protein
MSAYVRSQEIVERLRLELPMKLELPDPWTGEPFQIDRRNYLAALVIDSHNLVFEGQAIPALYAEAGRAARAAEYQAELAATRFARWKAQRVAECLSKAEQAKEKRPTDKQTEAFYRTHDDYEKLASAGPRYHALAGVLSDVREAFRLKSKLQHDQVVLLGAYENVMRVEGELDRLSEIEVLEREAEDVIAKSGSAKVAAEVAAAHKA